MYISVPSVTFRTGGRPSFVITAIGLAFLAIGLGALYGWRKMRAARKASRAWPATQGRVTATRVNVVEKDMTAVDERPGVRRVSTRYVPEVTYEYAAGPTSYSNNRLTFGTKLMSQSEAAQVVAQYPVQREVTVYYDPGQPQSSVLERRDVYGCWPVVALLAGLLFALVGALMAAIGLSAKA